MQYSQPEGLGVGTELSGLDAAKVDDLLMTELGVIHFLLQSQKVLDNVSEMQRAEIVGKRLVHQFTIDREVMHVIVGDRESLGADPVETILGDFDTFRI